MNLRGIWFPTLQTSGVYIASYSQQLYEGYNPYIFKYMPPVHKTMLLEKNRHILNYSIMRHTSTHGDMCLYLHLHYFLSFMFLFFTQSLLVLGFFPIKREVNIWRAQFKSLKGVIEYSGTALGPCGHKDGHYVEVSHTQCICTVQYIMWSLDPLGIG